MFFSFSQKSIYSQRFLGCLALVLLCILFCSPAFAASPDHGEHHAPGIGTLLWPVINFTLYVLAMTYGYKRLAAPSLKQQRAEIKEQYESGRVELADAQRALDTIKARNENVEKEREDILAALEAEGDGLAAAVLEKAAEDVVYQKSDLSRRIAGEQSKVQSQLREAVVRRATLEARDSLSNELDDERDTSLRQDAISRFRA